MLDWLMEFNVKIAFFMNCPVKDKNTLELR